MLPPLSASVLPVTPRALPEPSCSVPACSVLTAEPVRPLPPFRMSMPLSALVKLKSPVKELVTITVTPLATSRTAGPAVRVKAPLDP